MQTCLQSEFLPPAAPLRVETLCDEMHKLGWVAQRGRETALRVAQIGGDPAATNEVILLGEALGKADEGIARLAYARPELMPLAAQFTYAKENLDSTELVELAAETAKIYADLAAWCDKMARCVEELAAALGPLETRSSDAA